MNDPRQPTDLQYKTSFLLEDADDPDVSDQEYEERRQQLEKEWEEENRPLREADGFE
jgi:hypothetical protein